MRSFRSSWSALTVAGLVVACATAAVDADEVDRLREQVETLTGHVVTLSQQVQDLTAQTTDDWLTETRAEEIRGIVQDVLADADTRTSLLQDGVTAGYDRGFYIASPDGNFRLNLKGQIQFRFIYSHQNDGPVDSDRYGFENTRTRFGFGGHIVDPSWKYFIWAGGTGVGSFILLDAWIEKQFDNGLSIRAGQFKLPTWQEWTVFETRQQFVERSVLDARYAQVYAQGVLARYTADAFRLHFAFSDGLRTLGTPWSVGPDVTRPPIPYQMSNEFALTGRGEFKFAGDWSQYGDFTSFRGDDPVYVVGASVHYQVGDYGTDDDEIEILQWTVDGSFKFGGANVYAAVIGTSVKDQTVDRDELGFLIQGGYFVADDWELMARYAYGDNDGAGAFEDRISVLTVGVNYFVARHALKWTTDVGYAFMPIDPSWEEERRGYRVDDPDESGQVVVRTQVQLLF